MKVTVPTSPKHYEGHFCVFRRFFDPQMKLVNDHKSKITAQSRCRTEQMSDFVEESEPTNP